MNCAKLRLLLLEKVHFLQKLGILFTSTTRKLYIHVRSHPIRGRFADSELPRPEVEWELYVKMLLWSHKCELVGQVIASSSLPVRELAAFPRVWGSCCSCYDDVDQAIFRTKRIRSAPSQFSLCMVWGTGWFSVHPLQSRSGQVADLCTYPLPPSYCVCCMHSLFL